jgi:ATP-binding cassette subfamily B multidrug efflux pump
MLDLFKTYLRPYRWQLLVVMALLMAQAIGNLYLPELNAEIINKGVAVGNVDFIISTGGFMLLVTVVLIAVSVVSVYLGSKTSMAFGRDVRAAIFRQVDSFSQTEVNRFGTPSLITRNTNDVQQVQMVVMMALTMMILAPIMAIGGIIMAIRQDLPLSSLLVVILPLLAAFMGVMIARAMPLFRAMQVKIDRINQVMRETLSGVRVIRAFVRDDF